MTQIEHDDHREGFDHDLPVMQARGMVGRPRLPDRPLARRGLLGLVGGLGAVALVGCGSDDGASGSSGLSTSSGAGAPPAGAPPGGPGMDVSQEGLDDGDIPAETGGPYPADGTNGVNVLTESGIVRSDIRSSFGTATGVAAGVPLTIALKVYDNGNDGLAPYQGAAIYLWHCDRDGEYSLYSSGLESENYLRGVQEVAADGTVTFTSIFPACYAGRWPHIHFEVYESLDAATSASGAAKLRTSQIALPQDACETVYGTAEGYAQSRVNLGGVGLDTDGIFSDGHSLQLARLTGSVAGGYTLRLNVPV